MGGFGEGGQGFFEGEGVGCVEEEHGHCRAEEYDGRCGVERKRFALKVFFPKGYDLGGLSRGTEGRHRGDYWGRRREERLTLSVSQSSLRVLMSSCTTIRGLSRTSHGNLEI